MPFAARSTDNHACSMGGGPIAPAGAPTVKIDGLPAAVLGDVCGCTVAGETIAMGSLTVKIDNKPAARMGDPTTGGGSILTGSATVTIGG